MVELLITMSIMVAIVAVVIPFFQLSVTSFSSMEARSSIGNVNQKALNRILSRLAECKRIFEGDASGNNDFLSKVSAGRPSELSGNKLPAINESGSLTPGTASFDPTAVGNRLFYTVGIDLRSGFKAVVITHWAALSVKESSLTLPANTAKLARIP